MQNYIGKGDVVIVSAPSGGVTSGQAVKVGDFFGVAQLAAAEGADVPIAMEGVFDLPKTSAQAWTVGVKIYWDATNSVCTTASSGNKLIGGAVLAAANPSGTGRVLLNKNI